MPGGIAVTPEQLQTIAAQLNSGCQEVHSLRARLSQAVAPLEAEWSGVAQAQFIELWSKWQRDAASLEESLEGLMALTSRAAQGYGAAEQEIITSFRAH